MKGLVLLAFAALLLAGCSGGASTVTAPDVQKVNARKDEKG